MIAFILAAGASTRLKPNTLSRHKCLLEIFDNKKKRSKCLSEIFLVENCFFGDLGGGDI